MMSLTSRDVNPDEIVLPTLKYGYCETPLQWQEIQQIVLVEHDFDRLTRSASQQRQYELSKRAILREWASMLDYVLCTKFNLPSELQEGLKRVVRNDGDNTTLPRTALVRNDFPYCFEESVQHWILWKLGADCTVEDIQKAKKELQSQLLVQDMLHWVNPPRLQSLPGIDHVHILVLVQGS
ncbi:hypothetical protein FisN_14Hu039 [Fistulifera solaris]|uniref:Uncharacterized protein n=1 Tax=Fistulifera solaris TaxID=1519565 RepID=A0A1Z5K8D7_FISSO|nr:hypothetical protein FisN_14Hu039 [Fistulifera solaris]|eukprot:GAX22425.1 hypothetical protein FisN_14Hu039 [Fistulifera solaris]